MLKRLISLLFIATAYVFIIGHSIIPHHHHATIEELTEHHQTHHQQDCDESQDLSYLFSHFIHSADGFTILTNYNLSKVFLKQVSLTAVLLEIFCFDRVTTPQLLYYYSPPEQTSAYVQPHSLSSGLRAPPVS